MRHLKTDFDLTIENFKALETNILEKINNGTLIAGLTPDLRSVIVFEEDYRAILHFPTYGFFCMGGVGVEFLQMKNLTTSEPVDVLKVTSKRICQAICPSF